MSRRTAAPCSRLGASRGSWVISDYCRKIRSLSDLDDENLFDISRRAVGSDSDPVCPITPEPDSDQPEFVGSHARFVLYQTVGSPARLVQA